MPLIGYSEAASAEAETFVGAIEFSLLVSTGLSAVQEEVKKIEAKQIIASNSFFIKKCLKN